VGARSKARKRAVDILFEADLRGEDPVTLIAGRIGSADVPLGTSPSLPSSTSKVTCSPSVI